MLSSLVSGTLMVVAGILMLGVLVFVHELGHFVVAKLAGVKVLKFSLGFGPRLISRKWGETEYMICAVPLGGYVQMFGESSREEDDEPVSEEDRGRSFSEKPPSRRLAIIAAGPFMNLLLPFLVLPLAYMIGVSMPAYFDQPACVGFVVPASPAAEAGLSTGDCIAAIGQRPVESWGEANKALLEQAGKAPSMTVRRREEQLQTVVPAAETAAEGLESLGLLPRQAAVIGMVVDGMPAQKAGLQAGDRIVAVGEEPIGSWYDLKGAIQRGGEEPQVFQVERDGRVLKKVISPLPGGDNGYLIGIQHQVETVFKSFALWDAVKIGADQAVEWVELTMVFIKKLIFGHVSAKNIGGPITVVQWAGQAAQNDFSSLLSMLAFLSIQLGILNLFPIPILDGGHLLFNLFELVFRRPLSPRVREIAQQVGLVLILLLMALAFYNDILRVFNWGQ
ncbi:MAG: RIP metalloprotease RseP [Syntrophotaleaceae bacterium]